MLPESEIDTRARLHAPESFRVTEDTAWERWVWRVMVVLIAAFGLALLWLPAPAAAQAANAANAVPDTQVRVWAASCAACHGTDGKSNSAIPSINGQDKAVLLQKLLAYQRDQLPATVMHQHAKGYTEAQLERLADHFSRLPK